ncbi:MAG: nucleoside monophosphate kinase [bacterium]|nr:nucleoside monophosphate kinase [bacterium]
MKKIAVVIYGPPGSGKGTQADLIAEHYGLVHFDTGKVIERAVHDSQNANDPIIQQERQLFDTGILCTPEWVLELVTRKIAEIAEYEGKGMVFSGSPRTTYEAEGDKEKNISGVIPTLERVFGKENLIVLRLNVSDESSIFRNSHRRVCENCQTPLLFSVETEKLTHCPKCGGKIVTRTLDTPETIKVRLEEYKNRTEPIFQYLKSLDISIIDIDGEPDPVTVTQNIFKEIDKRLGR